MRVRWARLVGLIGIGWFVGTGNAQTLVHMDYGKIVADFDTGNMNPDIAINLVVEGTWGDIAQSLNAAGATLRLDSGVKFSGLRSQAVIISRTSGASGRLTLFTSPIRPDTFLPPSEGYPVLIRVAFRAENLSNVRYTFRYRMGNRWGVLLPETNAPTAGWQTVSQVVPAERDSTGQVTMHVRLDILLGDGACSGRFWIDNLQVLGPPMTIPMRVRPNPIRIANVNLTPRDMAELSIAPVDLVVGPRTVNIAKHLFPHIQQGVYFTPLYSFANLDWQEKDLFDYQSCNTNHPSWFLVDPAGNRVMNTRYANERAFYMDIGHPQAQNRVVERLRLLTRERYFVPEWVFFDNWSDWVWEVTSTQQYPNWSSMMPAWTSLLNRVAPVVRQELGAKLLVNIGSRIGIFLDGNVGETWLPNLDGIMQEGGWVIYNTSQQRYLYRNYASRSPVNFTDAAWLSTLRAITSYPDKTWVIIAHCDPNDREMFRYIIASYLIAAHPNCFLTLDSFADAGAHTFRLFNTRDELFVPLGNATGSYRIEQGSLNNGALFARDFQYGIVLVNPHPELEFQYRTPRAYKDWDGNIIPANTLLTIRPRRGVVLYAAPEITMSISPQQVTALPGETVTLTVQYRNDGLADATNVKISVPLPDGLEFVSSSTGGQFLNRQITWTLPQVRAGQSGTLTFQARVQ